MGNTLGSMRTDRFFLLPQVGKGKDIFIKTKTKHDGEGLCCLVRIEGDALTFRLFVRPLLNDELPHRGAEAVRVPLERFFKTPVHIVVVEE